MEYKTVRTSHSDYLIAIESSSLHFLATEMISILLVT